MTRRFDRLFVARISDEDYFRLELIKEVHGISMAGALRMSLIAMCRQLGMNEALPKRLRREGVDE